MVLCIGRGDPPVPSRGDARAPWGRVYAPSPARALALASREPVAATLATGLDDEMLHALASLRGLQPQARALLLADGAQLGAALGALAGRVADVAVAPGEQGLERLVDPSV
ncbi:MAG: hypothetical protein ACOCUS_01015, partial [Polyangiales bacterium]